MKFLQKLGKALMLPVAVLPICGILMGIGYYMSGDDAGRRHRGRKKFDRILLGKGRISSY